MNGKQSIAYDYIQKRLFDATYPAHYYIDEDAIASDLGMSRTPVHQAVLLMAEEGYVKIFPKRGIIVLPYNYQNVMDICQMRYLLEPWLIEQYGPMLTKEEMERERELTTKEIRNSVTQIYPNLSMNHHPHNLLMSKCTNAYINNILSNIEKNAVRFPNERKVTKEYNCSLDIEEKLQSHIAILDAIEAKEFSKAADLMRAHVAIAKEEFCKYWFE